MLEVALAALAVVAAVLVVWALDPIFGFVDNTKINLNNPENWRTTDRYTEGKTTPSPHSVDISLVFPAYNEEKRLPITLSKANHFLKKWSVEKNVTYEVIIVDDGSKDGTVQVAKEWYSNNRETFRVVSLVKNQGKGGAVKVGVSVALGKTILMVDADGATEIEDLDKLYSELLKIDPAVGSDTLAMVIGSRAHMAETSVATRQFYRTVLMKGFHLLVMVLCTRQVQDTQCGFKLLSSKAAKTIFSNLHLYRWAFDIDLIYQAEAIGVRMKEVAVNWKEIEGSKLIQSKLDVVTTSLTMARDMLCVRLAYVLGIWSLPTLEGSGFVAKRKDL